MLRRLLSYPTGMLLWKDDMLRGPLSYLAGIGIAMVGMLLWKKASSGALPGQSTASRRPQPSTRGQ
jgi:hypothetical protein